jgi:hypothetical protein
MKTGTARKHHEPWNKGKIGGQKKQGDPCSSPKTTSSRRARAVRSGIGSKLRAQRRSAGTGGL